MRAFERNTPGKHQRKEAARAYREVKRQRGRAAVRAKYGPRGAPAPVVTRSLDTGAVIEPKPKLSKPKKRYAPGLERAARCVGYDSYADYLLSPHWRELRHCALERDGHRCRCGHTHGLVVHHVRYRLGREELDDLVTLCHGCHRKEHGRKR